MGTLTIRFTLKTLLIVMAIAGIFAYWWSSPYTVRERFKAAGATYSFQYKERRTIDGSAEFFGPIILTVSQGKRVIHLHEFDYHGMKSQRIVVDQSQSSFGEELSRITDGKDWFYYEESTETCEFEVKQYLEQFPKRNGIQNLGIYLESKGKQILRREKTDQP